MAPKQAVPAPSSLAAGTPAFLAAKAALLWQALPRGPRGRVQRGAMQQLAAATQNRVTGDYLYQLRGGKIQDPAKSKLDALAGFFELPPEWWDWPLECGLQPAAGTPALLARLAALPPERQPEVTERLLQVLQEIESEE